MSTKLDEAYRLPPPPARHERAGLRQIRDLDDLFLNGVLHELGFVVDVQFAHQIELVSFHRFYTQVEVAGDLFH